MSNQYLKLIPLFAFGVAMAQPVPPNAAGVSFQNFEFNQETPQAQFWNAIVGEPQGIMYMARLSHMTFQNTRFSISLVSERPAGGTAGSVVDHIGIRVKNLSETLARVKAGGFKIEEGADSKQVFFYGPEGLKIEAIEDPVIAERVQWDHIHFYTEAPEKMRTWYQTMLGAVPDNSGPTPAADLPGIRLVFSKSESTLAPTKGRVMDHVQFWVVDLEQLRTKLQAEGAALEPTLRIVPPQKATFARVTDPWGTYIVLTEMPTR